MTDRELAARVEKSLATLKIIWGAMLFSLAIYLFIGVYLSGRMSARLSDPDSVTILRAILYAVSLGALVFSMILRSRTLAKAREEARPAGGEEGAEVHLTPVLARYATAMIIALGLSESVGIYGLVLSFLGGDLMDLYTLIGVSAAAMVYYRPRRDEVMKLMAGRKAGGTGYPTAQRD